MTRSTRIGDSHNPLVDSVVYASSNVTHALFVAAGLAFAWTWRRHPRLK